LKHDVENNIGLYAAFTPNFIEGFSSKVSIDFKKWIEGI